MIFVTADLPTGKAELVSVECGVGGVGFCILLKGAPHFPLRGEPATAMANSLCMFSVIQELMMIYNIYIIMANSVLKFC